MSELEFTITESPNMVSLEEYIDYLIIERVSELAAKVIKQDESYQKIQKELISCNQKLSNLLSKTKFNEIIEETLDPAISDMEMILLKLAYRQGLKDGTGLCGVLKVWG